MKAFNFSPSIFVIILLVIALIVNLYVIFKNEKRLHAILWTIFVVCIPGLGTLVYMIYNIVQGFAQNSQSEEKFLK